MAGAGGIMDAAVDQMGAFLVNTLGIGGDDFGGYAAQKVQHHFVLIDGFLAIGGNTLALFGEAFFSGFGYTHHVGMVEV